MYPTFSIDSMELTPYLFFSGKGGVGKTSTASATAVGLADLGKKVLIVSTDPASNLQDVFRMDIPPTITPVPTVPGLDAVNLDPEAAAAAYREKLVGPYRDKLPQPVVAQMEEQLSGACTVEIAAFDEFANLLTKEKVTQGYDHIIFDTAPTGHTLRLLQLPSAWTNFLEDNTHGASCLGPLSGLAEKKTLYEATVEALSNKDRTTLMLVTRPDQGALAEGERAARELSDIGIKNQVVIMNGIFEVNSAVDDDIADSIYTKQQQVLKDMSEYMRSQAIYQLPYVPFPLTGIDSLRKFFTWRSEGLGPDYAEDISFLPQVLPGLQAIKEDLMEKSQGVIMTLGKGGVGKTTVATALALSLAKAGKKVHLTTTDPAAHIDQVLKDEHISEFLTVSRIDPTRETAAYREEVLSTSEKELDEEAMAFLEEDLNSPCTEEIAIFRAFAEVVDQANDQFVIIDTAPTGHTLLLLDASQSFSKEVERSSGEVPDSVKKLLPRLRNPEETNVIIVTLPEATPVLEASRLQTDLQRAEMSPSWWVINQSFAATKTTHPVLRARAIEERIWIKQIVDVEAEEAVLIPYMKEELIGSEKLLKLVMEGDNNAN
ncbi:MULTISPECIES: arsenical pump-driving ATPase [Bacillaceae]|uniref:Arsenical pump-driving ATPase n=1 Tax=Evansella alkalicola TaxID=745819 RepID=A0ABS6K265_9BACI|nr:MULTISPECIES: arsenical pump-driving ATPase [Bacillaceae]MBU9723747.1 arsenical pump-driving ATPase [Bacillus alkalicola]